MTGKASAFVTILILTFCVSSVCGTFGLLNGFSQEAGRGIFGFNRGRGSGRGQSGRGQSNGRQETPYGPIGKFGKFLGEVISGRRN